MFETSFSDSYWHKRNLTNQWPASILSPSTRSHTLKPSPSLRPNITRTSFMYKISKKYRLITINQKNYLSICSYQPLSITKCSSHMVKIEKTKCLPQLTALSPHFNTSMILSLKNKSPKDKNSSKSSNKPKSLTKNLLINVTTTAKPMLSILSQKIHHNNASKTTIERANS